MSQTKAQTPRVDASKARSTSAFFWSRNQTDGLISEASSPENIRTFLGKQEPGENTSGDLKSKVYARIAAALFPAEYPTNEKVWKKRVQNRWEYLGAQYRVHGRRLRKTGEGVKPDPEATDSSPPNPSMQEVELQHYIPPNGPDDDTPEVPRNIWVEITQKFPYFPRMHQLLSSRANQVPIAITTAITPSGPTTTLHQPPSESGDNDDTDDVPSTLASPSKPTHKRTSAQASLKIHGANKRSASFRRRGPNIEDRFLEIQKQLQARILEHDKHVLKEKKHLLDEFKLGLITREEYREAARRLEAGVLSSSVTLPVPPSHLYSSNNTTSTLFPFSPEWDNLSSSTPPSEFAGPSL